MRSARSIRGLVRHAFALAGLLAVSATGSAHAQFGEAAGFAEAMTPEWYRRDLQVLAEGLQLDDAQDAILQAMFWDYEDSFEEGKRAMLQSFTDPKDELDVNDPNRIMQIIFAPLEQWITERRRLGEEFKTNVQVILTPQQLQLWPKVMQQDRREKRLPSGKLSGESVNLFHVVRDGDYDPALMANLEPMLESYAAELDEALRAREDFLSRSQSDIIRSLQNDDVSLGISVIERQINVRKRVRDVNDDYTMRVAALLPEAEAAEFVLAARERGYPRIYRPTPVQRLFQAAIKLEEISEETRGAIRELESAYLRELAAMNERLLVAFRAHEPEDLRTRAAAFLRRMGHSPEKVDDPTRPLLNERQELDKRYADQLRGLLGLDQFKALPGGVRFLAPGEGALPNHSLGGSSKKRVPVPGRGGRRGTGRGDEKPGE